MNLKPLISIIITYYRKKEFIKKTLNSIHKQSYKNYELIFVGRGELDLSSNDNIDDYFNKKGRVDIIINCAAYTAVDAAEEEQELANQINNLAVEKLAIIANKHQSKLIHISTDYVFDGDSEKPYIETDETNPVNVYGKTKLAGEQAIQEVMPTNAIIIRTSWLYSWFSKNFVTKMLELGRETSALNLVGDQIGSPTYAVDLAEAILKIINSKVHQSYKRQPTEIYHYSNSGEISWFVFAKEIFKLSNIECEVNKISMKDFHSNALRPINTSISCDKISNTFLLSICNWKQSLRKFFVGDVS